MKNSSGTTWSLLRPHVRPRMGALLIVLALGFITAFAQAASLLLIAGVWRILVPSATPIEDQNSPVDGVAGGEEARDYVTAFFDALEAWSRETDLTSDPRMALLFALTAVATVLALVAGFSMWGFTRIGRRVAFQLIVDLRMRLAEHLLSLSMRYHGQRRFGDLLSRVSADVGISLVAVQTVLRSLILEPIKALGVLVMMLFTAPAATLGIVLCLPIALLPVARIAKRVRKGSKKSLVSLGASMEALTQTFLGIRTVKSFGGEERELASYRALNEDFLSSSMKMVRSVALAQAWTAFYSIAGIGVLVLLMGSLNVHFGIFSDGPMMAAWFVLAARLNNHLKNFAKGMTKMGEAAGAADRIQGILDEEPDVVDAPEPVALDTLERGLRLEGVSFTYPDGKGPALHDIDLELRPGETLALVGSSGSGKSTLMDLIARFIDPSSGRIAADGVDLKSIKRSDWVNLTAMVSQTPFLFHTTIRENIAYGREGATQDEIEEASRAADIHDFIASLPEGYDTDVADMGTRLSGGQRQRITIARALLKGAPLLLLDEATSALDSESEAEVQAALERLMANRTVLVIAHRLSTIRNADRIVVLENGCVVETGTHAELLRLEGRYAKLHGMQGASGSS